MAQADKSAYYRALKAAGIEFERHYREYTTEDLRIAWEAYCAEHELDPGSLKMPPPKDQIPTRREDDSEEFRQKLDALTKTVGQLAELVTAVARREERAAEPVRAAAEKINAPKPSDRPKLDPNEHAGVTLNSHAGGQVLEVDEYGNQWFQKEVAKPAFPKPRGRRVLRYQDPGVTKEQIKVGEYVEEFEVAGDGSNSRPAEIKVTLPSYQTGIYKPPNMPFRVHTYQGARGFNLFDVQEFYGGVDLVPAEIKRCYVSTDLCYDISSTIRAIENEYRERVLKSGKGLS